MSDQTDGRALLPSGGQLVAVAAAICAAVVFLAQPFAIPASATNAAALAILAIGLWSTRVLPEHTTAIGFFLVAIFFSGVSTEVVFSGFSSTAFWLTFGGLIIGVAIIETGLGQRLARAISTGLGASYWRAVAGAALIGVVLAFLMPSTMGRSVLLVPIISALADELGFASGSRGRTGMILSAAFSTYMISAGILPANLPNVLLLGLSDSIYHLPITYGAYLLLHFPITSLLKVGAVVIIVCIMFPDRPQPRNRRPAASSMSRDEKWLGFILGISILLWMTDFVHHVSPAWIALAAGVICLSPRPGLVSTSAFSQKVNYGALFFVAAFLGLASIVAESGLGTEIGTSLATLIGLEPGQNWWNFAKLSLLATIVSMTTTTAGVPAVLTPMAANLAAAADMPLMTVLMTQVFGFSTFLLPYQGAPLLVTMQLGAIRTRDCIWLCIALTAVTFLILIPLNYFWWNYLGYFR